MARAIDTFHRIRALSAAETGGKVSVTEPIAIKDLSSATGVKAADIVKTLFLAGKPAGVNSNIDAESAIEVMLEFGIELDVIEQKTAEEQIQAHFKAREMADERSRNLEREAAQGDAEAAAAVLLDRIRAGELTQEHVVLAASLGHLGARDLAPEMRLVQWAETLEPKRQAIQYAASLLDDETLSARVAADWPRFPVYCRSE